MSGVATWRDYQEEAAKFFRKIGLSAETDVRLHGVRTFHDVDVVVRSHHLGFETLWLVECKQWNSPITKLHVLALREIVSDVGADRGIILAESGFQSGALEAARLTNVRTTSLAELRISASDDIGRARLRELQDRISSCRERYFSLGKEFRIEQGLRREVLMHYGYSGDEVLRAARHAVNSALTGSAPDQFEAILMMGRPKLFASTTNPIEVADFVDNIISDLEKKLDAAESALEG
ncbi:restriction endonuclease [Pseudofrankia saprophytica]|uniref:restriction endonuclease n=1 Tax=Pseudofrankia saprophytica TaxID=298655 RepID=UPI000D090A07